MEEPSCMYVRQWCAIPSKVNSSPIPIPTRALQFHSIPDNPQNIGSIQFQFHSRSAGDENTPNLIPIEFHIIDVSQDVGSLLTASSIFDSPYNLHPKICTCHTEPSSLALVKTRCSFWFTPYYNLLMEAKCSLYMLQFHEKLGET